MTDARQGPWFTFINSINTGGRRAKDKGSNFSRLMGDTMAKLPKKEQTTHNLIEQRFNAQEPRPYLGMSILGHQCERFLWYAFRLAYPIKHEDRMSRLFNRGHRIEDEIRQALLSIGYKVTGIQKEFVTGFGHIKGHWDGDVMGVVEAPVTPHVLEVKSMKDTYFKKTCKQGVRMAMPTHFGQCQLYMKFGHRKRTLYIAVNKNDDSLYIERVKRDMIIADKLIKRGTRIVLSEFPPVRPFSPSWFECKWCDFNPICHGMFTPSKNCRTCKHVAVAQEGLWNCLWPEDPWEIPFEVQLTGCDKYDIIEMKD